MKNLIDFLFFDPTNYELELTVKALTKILNK